MKMSDQDLYSKIDAVRTLTQILVNDERAKFYILGLMDGFNIHARDK